MPVAKLQYRSQVQPEVIPFGADPSHFEEPMRKARVVTFVSVYGELSDSGMALRGLSSDVSLNVGNATPIVTLDILLWFDKVTPVTEDVLISKASFVGSVFKGSLLGYLKLLAAKRGLYFWSDAGVVVSEIFDG